MEIRLFHRLLSLVLVLIAATAATPATAAPLLPSQVGILVNTNDPQSVAVGEYYRRRRGIPRANIVRVSLPAGSPALSLEIFRRTKARIDRITPGGVQAFAVTWVAPYRVLCMSLNTAIAIGFDPAFCAEGCRLTRPSPYYDSNSRAPAVDFGIRPTMSIAARTLDEARALIDRGIRSDASVPQGVAYLLSTSDAQRNVRTAHYGLARAQLGGTLDIRTVDADSIRDRPDVLFYFLGAARVADLRTNRFLPGAVGDHLTSFGGDLLGTGQMSILDWISAGATGSYGTVTEPCNFPAKFPDIPVLMRRYVAGESLIEAYWKSVAMPGQGIFVGEPLARPFALR